MATGVACPPLILQFTFNNGQLASGGSVLTQVGGINAATYQDSGLATPLPNPIPLNSRGEISNATGASCQLFLTPNTVYVFTLFDGPNGTGNQINVYTYVNGILSSLSYAQTAAESAASVIPANLSYQPSPPYFILERYGNTQSGLMSACAVVAALITPSTQEQGTIVIDQQIVISSNMTIPASVNLKFVGAGQLVISNAVTVTYNGYVEAYRQFIFSLNGSGVINFSGSFQRTFRPEWWGSLGDGNTNDSAALIACLTQASASQGQMLLTALHATTSTLTIPNNIEIIGLGRNLATGFRPNGAVQIIINGFRGKLKGFAIYADLCTLPQTVVVNNGSGNCFNDALEDLYVFGVNQLAGNVCGVSLQTSQDILLSRVRVDIGTGGAGAGSLVGNITSITKSATPTVTVNTVSGTNPFAVGLVVAFAAVTGMTQINGYQGAILSIGGASGAWTAVIANIDTTGFSTYVSGGTMTSVAHGIEISPNAINVSLYKPDIEVATNGILICSNSGDVTILDPYIERHTTSGIYINNSSAQVRIKGGTFLNPSSGQNAITIDLTGPVSNVDIDSPAVYTTGGGVVVINGTGPASNVNVRGVPAGRINNANAYVQVKGSGPFSGTASFAAATTAAVVFVTPLLNNANYAISLSQSATSTSPPWITAKSVSGFTINFGAAFTGNVWWTVDQ